MEFFYNTEKEIAMKSEFPGKSFHGNYFPGIFL
jgi:hypothetical protein